ncbi:MAG: hypothetical protein ACO1RT_12220 [Planctomycetaceae bacterium]
MKTAIEANVRWEYNECSIQQPHHCDPRFSGELGGKAMTTQQHDIWLESEQHFDGRLPTHHLGFLFTDLPTMIRGAVSMALRNRSKTPGKQPNWIKKASDIRFTGHGGNGVTHLQFELPSLDVRIVGQLDGIQASTQRFSIQANESLECTRKRFRTISKLFGANVC